MRARVWTAFLFVALSCAPPPGQPTVDDGSPAVTAAAGSRGEDIYHAICWVCHGHGGHGDGPVADSIAPYRPPEFHTMDLASASPERLEQLFFTGLADDPEHPHRHTVLSALDPEHLGDALHYVDALSDPPDVTGSALNGREIFDLHCAGCHGLRGDGRGPVTDALADGKPADLRADSLFNAGAWDAAYERFATGSDAFHGTLAPAWGSVFGASDLWDLVAYISTLAGGG